ncbi:MAG TPA: hypothetical protein VKB34_14105, partial [Povalibacter sp.]|nr:hypothetical protein [Povalibacter sp.]
TRAMQYMPPAAIHQAMMAPNGPVAVPKARGSEKIPDPTMDPTTIAVSVATGSFPDDWAEAAVDAVAVGDEVASMAMMGAPLT